MEKPLLEKLSQIQFQNCKKGEDHHMLGKICLDNRCKNSHLYLQPLCEACEIEESHQIQRDIHKTEDLKFFLIKIYQLCYKTNDEEKLERKNENIKEELKQIIENFKNCSNLINKILYNLDILVQNYEQIIYCNKDYVTEQIKNFYQQSKFNFDGIKDQISIHENGEIKIKKINQMKIKEEEKSIKDQLLEYQKFLKGFTKLEDKYSSQFLNTKSYQTKEKNKSDEKQKQYNIIMKQNWIKKQYKNGEYYGEVIFDKMHSGDLNHCKRHGQGIFVYDDGDRYQGQYENGERTGQGIYYYSNGNRYEGEFYNNKFHGKGKFYYQNGDLFEGTFIEGKSVKLTQIQ